MSKLAQFHLCIICDYTPHSSSSLLLFYIWSNEQHALEQCLLKQIKSQTIVCFESVIKLMWSGQIDELEFVSKTFTCILCLSKVGKAISRIKI